MKIQGQYCKGPRWMGLESDPRLRNWRKAHVSGHDVIRRVDPHGEVLICCRTFSGHARSRMGPKLLNRCRPEARHTREMDAQNKS